MDASPVLQRVLLQMLRFVGFRKRCDVNGLDRERFGIERSAIDCCGCEDLPRLLGVTRREVQQDAFFGG
jgi:hypothetical protein